MSNARSDEPVPSIRAMRALWGVDKHERPNTLAPTHRLVLLCFAWHLNSESGLAWPSMQTVATACGLSRSHVKRIVRELMDQGLLVPVQPSTGGSRYTATARYAVDLAKLPAPGSSVTRVTHEPGSRVSPYPVHWSGSTRFTDEPVPGSCVNPNLSGIPERNAEDTPMQGGAPAAARADARGADTDDLVQQILSSRRTPMTAVQEQALRSDISKCTKPADALRLMLSKRHWNALPDVEPVPAQSKRSRHAGLEDQWKGVSYGR